MKLEPGDVVTCPNGHEICDVVNTIEWGMPSLPQDFGNWREGQSVGKTGLLVQPCAVCGERYVVKNFIPWGGQHIHVKGKGWFPPMPGRGGGNGGSAFVIGHGSFAQPGASGGGSGGGSGGNAVAIGEGSIAIGGKGGDGGTE